MKKPRPTPAALLTNIRLGSKGLARTNTLANSAKNYVCKKFYNIGPSFRCQALDIIDRM